MHELSSTSDRRVVLITGMSRGLGLRLGAAFWQTGVDIFGTARDRPALEAIAKRLAATPVRAGQRIGIVDADLRDAAAPDAIVQRCREELGS
jgi:NADP-dependent 3-hydroxy acid dehydrogenase YdfG